MPLRDSRFEEGLHLWLHVFRVWLREVRGRKYEPEVFWLDRFVGPQAVAVQVGASDGRHAYYLARRLGCREIHCFEPSPYSFRILNILKRLLRLPGIRTANLALAAAPGTTTLVTPIKRSGRLGLAFAFISDDPPRPDARDEDRGFIGYVLTEVPVDSLDHYFARRPLARLDLIRCDVEGAEMQVLDGARELIARHRPVLLLEVHPRNLERVFASDRHAVAAFFEGLGYSLFYLADERLARTAVIFDEPWRDYFCIPAEKLAQFGLADITVEAPADAAAGSTVQAAHA